jgi:hypothetical protein
MIKKSVDKEPKRALYVGEVTDLWTAFTAFHEAQALYQVGLNTTTDPDLRHVLNNAFEGSKNDTKMEQMLIL